jgi:hypothetical protein
MNNQSLKEIATCMLHEISLPSKLWIEVINCATYINKKYPHKYVKDMAPFESWSGKKLEVTHFFIFGSCAWAHIPSKKRKDLDPQRKEVYLWVISKV